MLLMTLIERDCFFFEPDGGVTSHEVTISISINRSSYYWHLKPLALLTTSTFTTSFRAVVLYRLADRHFHPMFSDEKEAAIPTNMYLGALEVLYVPG